jgi:hypothetical protein
MNQSNQTTENGCNYPCSGNSSQTCGGFWRQSVYFLSSFTTEFMAATKSMSNMSKHFISTSETFLAIAPTATVVLSHTTEVTFSELPAETGSSVSQNISGNPVESTRDAAIGMIVGAIALAIIITGIVILKLKTRVPSSGGELGDKPTTTEVRHRNYKRDTFVEKALKNQATRDDLQKRLESFPMAMPPQKAVAVPNNTSFWDLRSQTGN